MSSKNREMMIEAVSVPETVRRREIRVLIACMPKTGSTYLTTLVGNLPGMRVAKLVPGYHRREQEICLQALNDAVKQTKHLREAWRTIPGEQRMRRPAGFVTQMHVRYSLPTAKIISEHEITPIVLVRNIFDIVASLADHLIDTAPYMAMGYVSTGMREWPKEQLHRFIAEMVIPWYLNFFMCWRDCANRKLVTYEELLNDGRGTLQDIAAFAGFGVNEREIERAFRLTQRGNTRLNKGIAGRGADLAPAVKDRIRALAGYYGDVDFSPIGL
jgi:hypothetical protein